MCFLVIQESATSAQGSPEDRLSLYDITDFVSCSPYACQIKLMNSPSSMDGGVRYLAESHTHALALQALIAQDEKLGKLSASFLEQAMSV